MKKRRKERTTCSLVASSWRAQRRRVAPVRAYEGRPGDPRSAHPPRTPAVEEATGGADRDDAIARSAARLSLPRDDRPRSPNRGRGASTRPNLVAPTGFEPVFTVRHALAVSHHAVGRC